MLVLPHCLTTDRTPFYFAPFCEPNSYYIKSPEEALQLARLLISDSSLNDPFDYEICRRSTGTVNPWATYHFNHSTEVFSWLLQQSGSTHREQDLEKCVLFTIHFLSIGVFSDSSAFARILLEGRTIDSNLCTIQDEIGTTLLHCVACHLGLKWHSSFAPFKISGYRKHWGYRCAPENHLIQARRFIYDLVIGGSKLSQRGGYFYQTSLGVVGNFYLLVNVLRGVASKGFGEISLPPVEEWLEVLEEAGVDLVEYGRREKELFQQNKWRQPYNYFSFVYGPKPSDWRFWRIPLLNDGFQEFWEMTEHPERAMPGAWVDECESSDDGIYGDELALLRHWFGINFRRRG